LSGFSQLCSRPKDIHLTSRTSCVYFLRWTSWEIFQQSCWRLLQDHWWLDSMLLRIYSKFWIYCRISGMPDWRIEVHYRKEFIGYTKAVYYVIFNKLDYVGRLHFLQRDSFHLFWEIVSYSKHKPMSFGRWWADESNDVHLHISNGHVEDIGWRWPGAWCMKSP